MNTEDTEVTLRRRRKRRKKEARYNKTRKYNFYSVSNGLNNIKLYQDPWQCYKFTRKPKAVRIWCNIPENVWQKRNVSSSRRKDGSVIRQTVPYSQRSNWEGAVTDVWKWCKKSDPCADRCLIKDAHREIQQCNKQ